MARSTGKYEMDMTNGPLLKQIIRFSIPLMLTGILQLLFNAADVVVVGNFSSREALAAVTSTGSLINLIINVFIGLSVGAGVVVAQEYGANSYKDVQVTIHTSVAIGLIGGTVLGIFGVVMAKPLLELMSTPEDVLDLAALYMRIYFVGMPATLLYNFCSAIFRAVGDTKRPLYYLSIAGILNVILNLFFVIVCGMSVEGVAIATVVSQCVSLVLTLLCMMRSDGFLRLRWKEDVYKRQASSCSSTRPAARPALYTAVRTAITACWSRITHRLGVGFSPKHIRTRHGHFARAALDCQKNLIISLGMHEGAAAPSYLRPGLGLRRAGVSVRKQRLRTSSRVNAAFEIRRTGFAGSRSGPGGRFLYHFPAVTEGDRKMMQLEKMNMVKSQVKCNTR